jgi:hypothetical protein
LPVRPIVVVETFRLVGFEAKTGKLFILSNLNQYPQVLKRFGKHAAKINNSAKARLGKAKPTNASE